MGPSSAKAELRAAMRAVRRAIAADPVSRERRSVVINDRLIAAISGHLPDGRRGRVMVYEALAGEPDLTRVIVWAGTAGANVFVPEVDGAELVVEPGAVDPASLDVVVVPGLAFTAEGHRLGQGGGHFDRFLPRVPPSCLTIGVAFREQLVDTVPLEPHDVRLDVVITDA